ncbi:sugar phosphate isomerase/epimerase family protein [Paenibacillus xerothermodurans]|uniref:Sugar phosphate isomerase/epimerase n=1 Tax=Paenibacillus xerothermodurans TaxID=1977292 RepID=A0A2W1P3I6_PAEXE|nr:sugar phosphate isomerase/epimerase [Paenibacillus xerothermodurans]PZE22272.1 sugar phosphate isomerase/epimerase [Paenibacillus xerothermodurans]
MKKFPVALQPYTIRDELSQDYLGSLEKVAAIGYRGIELGPPEDMSVPELKAHLDRLGLQVISSHASLDALTNQLDALIDYLQQVGGTYAAHSSRFESKQQVLDSAAAFNRIGERCREHGIQFLYHNHNWEFVKFDGAYALDILLRETDPDLVKMELDTYWVKRGGEDPAEYLRKLCNRCPLLHIKDMEPGEEQFFAEIGEGVLDFNGIFQAAEEAGTEWLVVEQDRCRRPAFESIAISYNNLHALDIIQQGA